MKKKNTPETPAAPQTKKKGSGLLGRIVRRFFLLLFTIVILAVAALVLVMNLIFNGPSPAAREVLTMSLIEASATKWVPALFIGEETVAQIRESTDNAQLSEEQTDVSKVVIQKFNTIAANDEWANYPDGIRIEEVYGDTYTAHVMIIRDPSQVYMGTSTASYSTSIPGKRINEMMAANPDAIAAINAGAFFDNGTSDSSVGSYPLGLVMSENKCVWESGKQPDLEGFAGFNQENILVVSQKNLNKSQAADLGIRDGCCFGPALIINGEVNLSAYNNNSGYNPRTAIGQRSDGAVIFVCIDGRQAGSMGGTYADIINIMQEYGAVNACNMDGGSSSVMMYRDTYNLFPMDEDDDKNFGNDVKMINNYSLLQSQPRKMPNFWMVRAAE